MFTLFIVCSLCTHCCFLKLSLLPWLHENICALLFWWQLVISCKFMVYFITIWNKKDIKSLFPWHQTWSFLNTRWKRNCGKYSRKMGCLSCCFCNWKRKKRRHWDVVVLCQSFRWCVTEENKERRNENGRKILIRKCEISLSLWFTQHTVKSL